MARRKRGGNARLGLMDGSTIDSIDDDDLDDDTDDDEDEDLDADDDEDALADAKGDVGMEELLIDLLSAVGVVLPETTTEAQFKRALYESTMQKRRELTRGAGNNNARQGKGNGKKKFAPNPLMPGQGTDADLMQEQQPMYMSLAQIAAITDPNAIRIALSLADENQALRHKKAQLDAAARRRAAVPADEDAAVAALSRYMR